MPDGEWQPGPAALNVVRSGKVLRFIPGDFISPFDVDVEMLISEAFRLNM